MWLLGCAITAAVACTGNIGDPADGGDGDDGDGCPGCTPSGITVAPSTMFGRVSHRQWENTIVDLFDLDAATGLSATFAPDPLGGKAFDNNAAALDVTPNLWQDYQEAAETVAAMVTGDPGLLAKIVPAGSPTAREWIEQFGRRAWRRPLTSEEIDQLEAVFNLGPTHYATLDAFTSGVRITLEAVLQSPHFVYRSELSGEPGENSLIPLSDWEVASRLSYTLWDSMPDELLFAAAEAGELSTDTGLRAQIDRLLASDRARVTLRSFFDQLSDADQYLSLSKSEFEYPDFDPAIGEDMREELARFVDHIIVEEDGGLRELLTSRTTFVTARLAELYGIDPSTLDFEADGYAQTELDPEQRSGILTRSGFLAWKGTETQPDSILRGVFINRRFICQTLGDPPDEAMGAELGDEVTNRERIEALTGAGTCGATCHGVFINPTGFAFENYGALGEFRELDAGQAIDASGMFPFADGEKSYVGALEFSDVLADSPQAHACFSRYWLEFVLARDLVEEDQALIDLMEEESLAGAPLKGVLAVLLESDAFRYRLAVQEDQQ